MKTIQKLQVLFLIVGISGFVCTCQKEEQVQQQLQNTSSVVNKQVEKEPEVLKYDDVIAGFRNSGAIEIPIEKSGINLKSISLKGYLSCNLFQTKTDLFMVLRYKDNSEELKQAQADCNQEYIDKQGFVDCSGTGTTCQWEIIKDEKGKEIGVRMIVCI